MAEEDDELAAALAMSLDPSSAPGPTDSAAMAPAAAAPALAAPEVAATPVALAAAKLRGNTPAVLNDAGTKQVLTTLLQNLIKNPTEEKFRKVKLTNAKISKALSCAGAEDLLLAAGFVKKTDMLEVPSELTPADVVAGAQAALDAVGSFGCFALSAQLNAEGEVRCVAALPGGGLATGAMDNVVRVYTPGEWLSPRLLFGHERRAGVNGVLALVAGGSGSLQGDLVSAGRDGKIIVWRDGASVASLSGHGEGVDGTNVHVVCSLGRRSDGALLSGGWDKTARAWDGEAQTARMEGHSLAVNAVVGLPTGEVASGSGDQTVGVWRGNEKLRTLSARAIVRALCSCGGGLLASGGNDGVVRVWDATTGQQLAEQKVADSYVLSLARCAETGELAAGCVDGTLALLALEGTSLRIVETLQHCADVYGLAFLESGDLAAACGDSSCVIWSRSPQRAAAKALQEDYAAKVKALMVAQSAAGASSTAGAAAPGGGSWDFTFPVELGGSKMTLQWNRGEEAQTVANRFIAANGLDPGHRGDVVAFVMHAQQQAQTGGGGGGGGGSAGGAAGGQYDFNYPVEVADGRRLMISWNRGDDPQVVALNFARTNGGIAANELPDIVNFIQQASGMPAQPAMVAQQAPPVSPAMQQQAMQQVMEMGFDEATARAALQATGWSVEAAVMRLLG